MPKSKTILSIQSHVAYGYVGNRAAVFPLQRMGYDVIALNTVQFSNHTGYEDWTGEIFSADHIKDVLTGIEKRGAFENIDAVLTGYMGDAALGKIVLDAFQRIREQNKDALYICDPVMGDIGRGIFVKDNLPPFFKNMSSHASVMTPNMFELGLLTGRDITTLDNALEACGELHKAGVKHVLVTSLITDDTPADHIGMLASDANGDAYLQTKPEIKLETPPNGSGDLTTALFTGHLLSGKNLEEALNVTGASVFKTFEKTKEINQVTKGRELALIQSQEYFEDGYFEDDYFDKSSAAISSMACVNIRETAS